MSAFPAEGAWVLRSIESRWDDGTVERPFGEATGRLMYADGQMAAVITAVERTPFASDDPQRPTAEEAIAAVRTTIAYYGTFSYDARTGTVVHHVEGSMFPNWAGGDQVRYVRIDGDRLDIESAPVTWDGRTVVGVLSWERARPAEQEAAA